EDREHCNLQNLILSNRLGNVLGKDMQKKIIPTKRSSVLDRGDDSGLRNCEPFSRATDVDRGYAQEQRKSSDDFKVDQAFQTNPAHAAQVAVSRDASDERSKNERRDDDLDEPQKDFTQHPQMLGQLRTIQPNLSA